MQINSIIPLRSSFFNEATTAISAQQKRILAIAAIALAIFAAAYLIVRHCSFKDEEKVVQKQPLVQEPEISQVLPAKESPKAKTESAEGKAVAKEADEVLPPIGFRNGGGTCWINSGLQILLANQYFEEIARGSLKTETVRKYFRGVPSFGDLTEEELQKRKNIQTAFIELLDRRAERHPDKIRKAIIHLHEVILQNNVLPHQQFPTLHQWNDSAAIIGWIGETFGFSDCIFSMRDILPFLNLSLPIEAETETLLKARFENKEKMPDLIGFINLPKKNEAYNGEYDLNAEIDLSKYVKNGQKAVYRIVGIAKAVPGHWFAYVRYQKEWYCCNDEIVMAQSLQNMKLEAGDHVILERVSA